MISDRNGPTRAEWVFVLAALACTGLIVLVTICSKQIKNKICSAKDFVVNQYQSVLGKREKNNRVVLPK